MVVLKNHVNIRKDSIKLVRCSFTHKSQVKQGDCQFYLDFKFDANYECMITVYLCAQECRNASNIPL